MARHLALRATRLLAALAIGTCAAAAPAADDQAKSGAPGQQDQKPNASEAPAGAPPQAAGPPPALVGVGSVIKREVQDQWHLVGRLVEVRRAVVAAEQSGRVVEAIPEQGDAVEAGRTVLARIDDVRARLALRAAEADLAQVQARVLEEAARLDQAQRNVRFLEELSVSSSAKPKEVSDARSMVAEKTAALAVAQAAVVAAEVRIARCQVDLAQLTVKAPFDGVVVAKMTEVGQWVAAGSPVAEMVSVGQIDALIDVPEQYVNFLSRGMEVEVVIEPLATTVTGKVASITPMGSSAARTFPVKVRFDDRQGRLKPGMSLTAHVPTGKRVEQLTVPRDAVKRIAGGTVVWADLNGKAMPIGVKVIFGVGDRYAVVPVGGGPPLLPGAQVVTEGAERLFPTQPLIVTNQPLPPTDSSAEGAEPRQAQP